jgi:oxygen-independent coproporphyrinogen-3 oxidase
VPEEVQDAVVEQTIQQAAFFLKALGPDRPIPTIFMGGGTPSTLSRPLLSRLLEAVGRNGCEEWTVEANPESIDQEFLDICHAAGVTRISVGVQSTDDERLISLGRSARRTDILRSVQLLRRSWDADLNLDFIAGIPGQEPSEVIQDLSLLDGLPASHVSLYSLTYEPGTPLERLVRGGRVRPNAEEKDEELWFAGVEELRRRGFKHYEVSNFCKPGKECRHNLRYWRLDPYLGVGPSAVSTLPADPLSRALGRPELARKSGVLRVTNPPDIPSFLSGRAGLWGARFESVEPEDFLAETLMMGLRLEEGIPTAALQHRFGVGFQDLFPGLWEGWVKEGVALPLGNRLAMSEAGRMILDGLLARLPEASKTRALRVSWP